MNQQQAYNTMIGQGFTHFVPNGGGFKPIDEWPETAGSHPQMTYSVKSSQCRQYFHGLLEHTWPLLREL